MCKPECRTSLPAFGVRDPGNTGRWVAVRRAAEPSTSRRGARVGHVRRVSPARLRGTLPHRAGSRVTASLQHRRGSGPPLLSGQADATRRSTGWGEVAHRLAVSPMRLIRAGVMLEERQLCRARRDILPPVIRVTGVSHQPDASAPIAMSSARPRGLKWASGKESR